LFCLQNIHELTLIILFDRYGFNYINNLLIKMADDGYGKYRKMLKMGVPRQQVNASMLMDGKDPDKFVEQDPNEGNAAGDSGGADLTLKGDVYDKYRKMLKCGLPMGAALQCMAKDGVDPKGFDVSGGGASDTAAHASAPVPAASAPSSECVGNDEGGFLSELKAKADKKVNSAQVSNTSSASTKPAATVVSRHSAIPVTAAKPVVRETPSVTGSAIPTATSRSPIPTAEATTSIERPVQLASSELSTSDNRPFTHASNKAEQPPSATLETQMAPSPVQPVERGVEHSNVSSFSSKVDTPSTNSASLGSGVSETTLEEVLQDVLEKEKAAGNNNDATTKEDSPMNMTSKATMKTLTTSVSAVPTSVAQPASSTKASSSPTASPAANSAKSPNSAPTTGKMWTPPAAKPAGDSDWKSMLAANSISVAPPVTKESAQSNAMDVQIPIQSKHVSTPPDFPSNSKNPVASTPVIHSEVQENSASPIRTTPILSKAAPAVSLTKTGPSPAVAAKPVSAPQKQAPQRTAAPVKPTNGSTLKKRHSNDWKAALAPHLDSPLPASGSSSTVSSTTSRQSSPPTSQVAPASRSTSSVTADKTTSTSTATISNSTSLNKPATPGASAPVNAARIQGASTILTSSPAATESYAKSASPVTSGSSTKAAATTNGSGSPKINAVGLKRVSEKSLPAWAAVEKPAFLVKPDATASPPAAIDPKAPVNASQNTITRSVNAASNVKTGAIAQTAAPAVQKSLPSLVNAPAKPTTSVTPTEKKPAVSTGTSATKQPQQQQYSTIPKGLQRRFAWE
jgi:hypothetical protein